MYVVIGYIHGWASLFLEEALALFIVALAQGLAEPAQGLLLLFVQVPGRLDGHGDILVAPAPAVEHRDTFALEAEDRAGLSALGDGILHLAVDGGNLQLCPQHRLGKGNGSLAEHIHAVPAE